MELLLQFEQVATSAIEVVLNRLIKDDPILVRELSRLKSRIIQLHIKELDKTLTFVFSSQIDVLANYEGEPDCYLSVSLSTLPELRQRDNITQLIKQDKLELNGDIELAQKFAQLLTDAKPDFEEFLSKWIGDPLSHSTVRSVKNVGAFAKHQATKQRRFVKEVLTEEWKVVPTPLEIIHFCDQVEQLERQTSALESRIDAMLEKE